MTLAKQVLILSGIALWLGCATTAQAGFITTRLDADSSSVGLSETNSGAATVDTSPTRLPHIVLPAFFQQGLANLPGSVCGMNVQPTVTSAASAAALPASHVQIDGVRPLSRLIVERESALPPPLASRLFRPPRHSEC